MDANGFFEEIVIPASEFTFGYETLHISNIVFDKTNEKCNITFAVA